MPAATQGATSSTIVGGRSVVARAWRLPGEVCRKIWKVGKEDTRRVIHALKVGTALTLVSFLYLLEPLFNGIGKNVMWAVMTVVVVLEFTAGATLCKGLNRGLGTVGAGSLAFLIDFVSQKSGRIFRAVFIGAAVFFVGFTATFVRFFPHIKKNYDYGVLIFLLTFNLITVSSYRVDNVLDLAKDRLYTIGIGVLICLFMSHLIFPILSGEDLHDSTVRKLEGLATSVEACVSGYFQDDVKMTRQESFREVIKTGYRTVLDSKYSDELSAQFSSWEPRRSLRCHRFPGKQYLKLGVVLRHFAYNSVALYGCLESEIQVGFLDPSDIPEELHASRTCVFDLIPKHVVLLDSQTPCHVRRLFREPCIQIAREVSRVLTELAAGVRNRRCCSPEVLSHNLRDALEDLNAGINSQMPRIFLGLESARSTPNASAAAATVATKKPDESPDKDVPSTPLLERRAQRQLAALEGNEPAAPGKKTLRPMLSKITITRLECSEVLPFSAFASLLVEMVARLDLVVEEVEELARVASFREFTGYEDDVRIKVRSGGARSTHLEPPTAG
ncbi:hypothetical protein Taro_026595 [Colocasia esculenta]|uniref:Aluminum-activated malate transporter 12 n=1 Tax=Colocasia esculenta TaxID=4460 RepID=A0A843VDC7_COLES|nr:hypothetical protein [Colocasia esculenta]